MENHAAHLHVFELWPSGESRVGINENYSRKAMENGVSSSILPEFQRSQLQHFTKPCNSVRILFLLTISSFFLLFAHADRREMQEAWYSVKDSDVLLDSTSIIQLRQHQDQEIQQAAFQAFDHHKTGKVYNVTVTGNANGATIQAMRLRTGSLRKRGLVLNEFVIPPGCEVESSAQRVLLVYENLGNSSLYSDSIRGYELVGPVVGLFAYDASNLTTRQSLPKLNVTASRSPISVQIPVFLSSGDATPVCASFNDNSANASLSSLSATPGRCDIIHLGIYTLAGRNFAPASAPSLSLSPSPFTSPGPSKGKTSNTWKIAIGSVLGALALIVLLSTVALAVLRLRRNRRFEMMEYHADQGETLHTALVRNTRAPTAGCTRTQPMLESEYVM